MSWDQVIVLAITLVATVAFVSEKVRSEVVALGVMCALALSGTIDSRGALAGFSSEAIATVAAMFVLSAALDRGGALAQLNRFLASLARSRVGFRMALMPLAGSLSAFVNNTAIVAVMLPGVLRIVRDKGWSPSKFLIPLSYASQFGGVCTLVGTSTNLLVHSLAIEAGLPGFGMFEFTMLGLSMLVLGTLYLATVGWLLLPDRGGTAPDELFELDDYVTELVVEDESLRGRRLDELDLPGRYGLTPLDLIRGERRFWRPRALELEIGDIIRVSGAARDFTALGKDTGLTLHAERFFGTAIAKDEERRLVEAMVPPQSPLVGRSAVELRLLEGWNAVLLAVRRHGAPMLRKLSNMRLAGGDVLLLMATREGAAEIVRERDLVILNEKEHAPTRATGALLPIALVTAAVALAALGWVPIWLAAIGACVLLLALGALSSEEAVEAIDWRVLFLIGGMLPLGLAMQRSGLAEDFVQWLFGFIGTDSPTLALALVYALTAVLTEVMSNNAAAVLLVPVGISIAGHFGVDAKPFLVAIAFAASTSFATPVGYQTNTMVYNAGNYRFTDFMRVGIPLNLLFLVAATFLIPQFFPFTPG